MARGRRTPAAAAPVLVPIERGAEKPLHLLSERERASAEVPPGTPADRAWARVVLECPDGRTAEQHRSGAFVHVVPFQHGDDVRCLEAEPVLGYTGFYRQRGGYTEVVSAGTPPAKMSEGVTKPQATVAVRKTFTYSAAEMTGR